MNVFYAERLANPGAGRLRMWGRVLGDLVVSGILEHLRVRRDAEPHDSSARPRLSTEDQMSVIVQELIYAARSLRKSVSFSAAALFTLALGISSTTAIFSVVESVLLAPLPFPTARRIVSTTGRHQFYTVRLENGQAVPAFKASGDITSMALADGYIEIAANVDIVEAGELVDVKLF